MGFSEWMFLVIALFSITCLLFWKKKIDPDGGTILAYLVWVLLCNLAALFTFNPWGILGQA